MNATTDGVHQTVHSGKVNVIQNVTLAVTDHLHTIVMPVLKMPYVIMITPKLLIRSASVHNGGQVKTVASGADHVLQLATVVQDQMLISVKTV